MQRVLAPLSAPNHRLDAALHEHEWDHGAVVEESAGNAGRGNPAHGHDVVGPESVCLMHQRSNRPDSRCPIGKHIEGTWASAVEGMNESGCAMRASDEAGRHRRDAVQTLMPRRSRSSDEIHAGLESLPQTVSKPQLDRVVGNPEFS